MVELRSVAELERLLADADDGRVVYEAQRNTGVDDAYRAGLYAAAAFNMGHEDLALRLAERIVGTADADLDTLYLACWLLVSLSDSPELRSRAIKRYRSASGGDERTLTLEFKVALRSLAPDTLAALAPRLRDGGLEEAAALAEAEALFLLKKWRKAAAAYGTFLGENPWRVVVKERHAYALMRSFQISKARAVLEALPVHSGRARELLELYLAKRSTTFLGLVYVLTFPLILAVAVWLSIGSVPEFISERVELAAVLVVAIGALFFSPALLALFRPQVHQFAKRLMGLDTARGPYRDLKAQIQRLGAII